VAGVSVPAFSNADAVVVTFSVSEAEALSRVVEVSWTVSSSNNPSLLGAYLFELQAAGVGSVPSGSRDDLSMGDVSGAPGWRNARAFSMSTSGLPIQHGKV
jgi:hypothetical protein